MRKLPWLFIGALLLTGCATHRPAQSSKSLDPALTPPDAPREFRAVWVATVANIDWPSKPGLSVSEQRSEMITILDKCKQLNMNAVVFQVRTTCDAFYNSPLEPWSYYLTGEQGKPPAMGYDPLRDWIEQSHARGMELHAWFNPYRARGGMEKEANGKPPYLLAPWHVANVLPNLVKVYGSYLWLDPGEPAAQKYTLAVMADVVRRYDVDGIHIDDYFYPYREKGKDGKEIDFPDGPSWDRYKAAGGKLGRSDWRRDNINQLVKKMYTQTKAIKPWVKVGISPFGVWRPGHPETVKSTFDAYESIYCDSKLWLNEGWADYFTPQLYWGLHEDKKPPYEDLLKWWVSENTKGRNIWPGLYTSRIPKNWEPKMILDQIAVNRHTPGATGEVHFSMVAMTQNRGGINDALLAGPYAQPALVPASPWLSNKAPAAPKFEVKKASGGVEVIWKRSSASPFLWLVQARYGDKWRNFIYPRTDTHATLPDAPDAVAVSAVDRLGNVSAKGEAMPVK